MTLANQMDSKSLADAAISSYLSSTLTHTYIKTTTTSTISLPRGPPLQVYLFYDIPSPNKSNQSIFLQSIESITTVPLCLFE